MLTGHQNHLIALFRTYYVHHFVLHVLFSEFWFNVATQDHLLHIIMMTAPIGRSDDDDVLCYSHANICVYYLCRSAFEWVTPSAMPLHLQLCHLDMFYIFYVDCIMYAPCKYTDDKISGIKMCIALCMFIIHDSV